MEKNHLLQQVEELSSQQLVTADELLAAYNRGTNQEVQNTPDHALSQHLSIGDILYYIGGAIVFLGIAVMIGGNWDDLNPFTRIIVTLGSGIVAYVVGVLLGQHEKYDGVAQAFYLISALVIPLGLVVVFDAAGIEEGSAEVQALIFLILSVVYGISAKVFQKTLFTIFTILFGTSLYFSLVNLVVGNNPILDGKFPLYTILIGGLSYMLLGYHFSNAGQRPVLSNWLYSFGVVGFLGPALILGGWSPEQSIFWELIYPGLVFGIIFLSVQVRSRAFLIWGSIFLMAYILKITGEYFGEGLGWPAALVLAGLMLIGVGYWSVYLNKRYISTVLK